MFEHQVLVENPIMRVFHGHPSGLTRFLLFFGCFKRQPTQSWAWQSTSQSFVYIINAIKLLHLFCKSSDVQKIFTNVKYN